MPPSASRIYLEATRAIPAGETRSFSELAEMAGRPGAARAAGRALAAVPADSPEPWHRVTSADGSLARDPERARLQLERLRAEGARPRAGEDVPSWARRLAHPWIAELGRRTFLPARDPGLASWKPARVRAFPTEASAREAGCRRPGEPAPGATPPWSPPSRLPGVFPDPRPGRLARRMGRLDWRRVGTTLLEDGLVHLPGLVDAEACLALARRTPRVERSVAMAPKGYGRGSYHFLEEPLPEPARSLRRQLYRALWPAARTLTPELPPTLGAFHHACRRAGQRRGTTILIHYPTGGENHPHQDRYGAQAHPFQGLLVLSARGRDFEGGAFRLWEDAGEERRLLAEVAADQGDLVLFGAFERRTPGGERRLLRHGMQRLDEGERLALGLSFPLGN